MRTTKLKIRFYGDPCLRKKSQPVKEVGPSERMLIQFLIETMRQEKGVGLAAPQVGLNQRIFVADIGEGPIAVINPQVIKKWGSQLLEEGCLSIPGINVEIKRPEKVLVKYKDENNETIEKTLEDLLARVFLHETDHLNGKLIIDYASLNQKRELKEQLKELEKQNKPK